MGLKREDGVLETEAEHGHPEIRLHRDASLMVRVPWHYDSKERLWYSGLPSPAVKLSAIRKLLEEQ